jgi:uncharacterized protein YbaR (Trm112 family)
MLDILACPLDKHFPLDLYEIISDKAGVKEGILWCPACGRYYPIIDEIPVMLPDELRDKKVDLTFLERWRDKVPDKVIKEGKPWHP